MQQSILCKSHTLSNCYVLNCIEKQPRTYKKTIRKIIYKHISLYMNTHTIYLYFLFKKNG